MAVVGLAYVVFDAGFGAVAAGVAERHARGAQLTVAFGGGDLPDHGAGGGTVEYGAENGSFAGVVAARGEQRKVPAVEVDWLAVGCGRRIRALVGRKHHRFAAATANGPQQGEHPAHHGSSAKQ